LEEWSNNACYGYAILAAKDLGMKDELIQDLINAMKYAHDMKTIDEAKTVYCKSSY
jgi:hypothetical protein